MPKPKAYLNAFTAAQVNEITGVSVPMINYLLRAGYLSPSHGHGSRGKVRYYSYRDLAVAFVIQRLRDSGIELKKIKAGIKMLSENTTWLPASSGDATPLRFLITDGKTLLLRTKDGFLDELTGQRAFAFVVDLESVHAEVLRMIPASHRDYFSTKTEDLIEANRPTRPNRKKARGHQG